MTRPPQESGNTNSPGDMLLIWVGLLGIVGVLWALSFVSDSLSYRIFYVVIGSVFSGVVALWILNASRETSFRIVARRYEIQDHHEFVVDGKEKIGSQDIGRLLRAHIWGEAVAALTALVVFFFFIPSTLVDVTPLFIMGLLIVFFASGRMLDYGLIWLAPQWYRASGEIGRLKRIQGIVSAGCTRKKCKGHKFFLLDDVLRCTTCKKKHSGDWETDLELEPTMSSIFARVIHQGR